MKTFIKHQMQVNGRGQFYATVSEADGEFLYELGPFASATETRESIELEIAFEQQAADCDQADIDSGMIL